MRRLRDVSELMAGMKTAAPVFGNDRMLLGEGTVLTWQTIMRLPLWGVFRVYVEIESKEERSREEARREEAVA